MGGGTRWWPAYEPAKPTPAEPNPPQSPTPTEQRLLTDYQNLRLDIAAFEEVLGSDAGLSERDGKEFDKAVVLLKAGAKLIKRRLRKHGYRGRLKCDDRQTAGAA